MPFFRGTRYPLLGGGQFLPSDLEGLKLWTRFNQGITVTGAGVSQWDDQSGEGNHLLQGTDTNRPSLESDGSILYDGVDNYLEATFTLNQPTTWYFLGKQITWTSQDRIMSGLALNVAIFQFTATPEIDLFAGSVAAANTNLVLDTDGVIAAVFNGASSVLQVDNNTATGDAGASNPGGIVVGATNDGASGFGNIQAKEVCVFNTAHDAATRSKVINYLMGVGGI